MMRDRLRRCGQGECFVLNIVRYWLFLFFRANNLSEILEHIPGTAEYRRLRGEVADIRSSIPECPVRRDSAAELKFIILLIFRFAWKHSREMYISTTASMVTSLAVTASPGWRDRFIEFNFPNIIAIIICQVCPKCNQNFTGRAHDFENILKSL